MKRLVLSLSLIAALALIVTTVKDEINVRRHSGTSIADGSGPPPPPWPPKPMKPRIVPPSA